MIPFHQTITNKPQHADRPLLANAKQNLLRCIARATPDFIYNLFDDFLTFDIRFTDLISKKISFYRLFGKQQRQRGARVIDTARRVDARRNLKTNRMTVNFSRRNFRFFDKRAQSKTRCFIQHQ